MAFFRYGRTINKSTKEFIPANSSIAFFLLYQQVNPLLEQHNFYQNLDKKLKYLNQNKQLA